MNKHQYLYDSLQRNSRNYQNKSTSPINYFQKTPNKNVFLKTPPKNVLKGVSFSSKNNNKAKPSYEPYTRSGKDKINRNLAL